MNDPRISQLQSRAKALFEKEIELFKNASKMSASDSSFVSTILSSGTLTDKVSAITLLIQESPLHRYPLLEKQLLHGMAQKKARRQSILALDSIKDLILNSLLPDRKLKYFCDQPILSKNVQQKEWILWYFEDVIKKMYFEFIRLLEVCFLYSLI